MDLKNFETTSTYAIEAVYRDYWFQIPEKYRLLERGTRTDHGVMDTSEIGVSKLQKKQEQETPLSYDDVEKKDDYAIYCDLLNNKDQYFDLQPFFDPELNFDNRLHYKLTNVNYPDRKSPWFIITWNCGNGILKSTLTNRRFKSATVETPTGQIVIFDFIDTEMDLTLCFTSNSLQGLFELQEHIRVNRREKFVVNARRHTILGEFPVSLKLIDSGLSKMSRDKGTLCTLTLTLKIDYPVIGNIKDVSDGKGIIKTIHLELDRPHGEGPDNHEVLSRDEIVAEEE